MTKTTKYGAIAILLAASLGLPADGVGAAAGGPPVEALVHSPYFKVRVSAARLLGASGDPQSRDQLAGLLTDPHPLVRYSALHALRRHGYPAGALTRLADDPDPLVRRYARAVD